MLVSAVINKECSLCSSFVVFMDSAAKYSTHQEVEIECEWFAQDVYRLWCGTFVVHQMEENGSWWGLSE